MSTITEIINDSTIPLSDKIEQLKTKSLTIPSWETLEKEYNPKKHPVITDTSYQDTTTPTGVEKVTRITCDIQRLVVKRMSELMFGIAVKRVFQPINDRQKEIALVIENILVRNRIDSMNIERGTMLFAACEIATLWYAVKQDNTLYGVQSPIKLRCKTFSPMNGESIYPYFDEYGDLTALSFGYSRGMPGKITEYMDVYTSDKHIKYFKMDGEWVVVEYETILLGKIPALYLYRPTPIWEDSSTNIYEIEWALSRNGNYLRKNSKPIIAVYTDETVNYGDEQENDDRLVMQLPQGSKAEYVTWQQASESLKFQIETLSRQIYTQLQIPDISYENMKTTPMSGEARKMMFIDGHLKVKEESGRWLEFFDREINVIKTFVKVILPSVYHADIEQLMVNIVITPYTITNEKDDIINLVTATGGKAIMSQREAIANLGWSSDVYATLDEIRHEEMVNIMEPTII